MFKLKSHPEIVIHLDKGLYKFGAESGTGKSYLVSIINKLASKNSEIEIVAYNYSDYIAGTRLEDKLLPQYKVAIIDEYGLYAGYGREAIASFMQHGIVIIDHKNSLKCLNLPYSLVCIDMGADKIEIY